MDRIERGCCGVVYWIAYLVALPIGFLIGVIFRHAKKWEETVPKSEPDDHLAELPKVWIETTPLGNPFIVTDCPRLASPYYEWDGNTKVQCYEWNENAKMQFIGERRYLWMLMKLAVQRGKAIQQ